MENKKISISCFYFCCRLISKFLITHHQKLIQHIFLDKTGHYSGAALCLSIFKLLPVTLFHRKQSSLLKHTLGNFLSYSTASCHVTLLPILGRYRTICAFIMPALLTSDSFKSFKPTGGIFKAAVRSLIPNWTPQPSRQALKISP